MLLKKSGNGNGMGGLGRAGLLVELWSALHNFCFFPSRNRLHRINDLCMRVPLSFPLSKIRSQ
jgi:hypothetical protein